MGTRARVTLIALLPVISAASVLAQAPFRASDSSAVITAHRAALTLDPLSRVYSCIDTLSVVYAAGASDSASVRLHPAYTPVSLTVGGGAARFRFEGGRLTWSRPSGGEGEEEIVVEFRGRVDFPSEYTRVTPDRAVLREEEILPWGPGDLRSGRLAITVPAEWSVIAPGRRVPGGDTPGRGTAGETRTHVFTWESPIHGIGWICAGNYRKTTGTVGGAGDPEFSLYRFPSDTARDDVRSGSILALCDSIVRFYGAAFVPYRYDALAVVEVEDWVAGWNVLAIAAPSFIMVKRNAFTTDDPFNRIETILPHEVAHQWWMGTVFTADRDAAFLSEGLCEYSSILYGEYAGKAGSRDSLPNNPLLRPLIAKVKRGTAIPLDTSVDIRAVLTQYLKASYVHHMLRTTIGDSSYRRLLREFASRFNGRGASIADFKRLSAEVSGRDLDWFFTQWVQGSGLPSLRVYGARSARTAGGWRVTGRLRVVGYERYTADVVVELMSAAGSQRTTVAVGLDAKGSYRNDVPFEFLSTAEPEKVVADPDGDLLLLRRLPEKLSDLRDPGEALMVVGSGPRGAAGRLLAGLDSARFRAMGWGVTIDEDTGVTLGDLQRDRVILYGDPRDNAVLRSLPRPFPMAASADSIVLGGETVRDSTLALLQAMENPWLPDGLLVWVQPFSGSARPELRPYDHSWVLVRGHDAVHSGTWIAPDGDLEVRVRPAP